MDVLFWVAASFGAGVWVGVQHRKSQRKPFRKSTSENCTLRSKAPPTTCTPAPSPPPPVKYRHSRWEEKEDLFWGMVKEGVILENKKYMTTSTEKQYLEKLEKWFGQYCRIFCQVSPGRFLKLPDQDAFSAEERARFFTQFNAMSVDYVLVSRKNNKIVCVIELDDKSHELDERITRDKRLEHMFEMAGVPLLRVNVAEMNIEPPVWDRRKAVEERMAVS